MSGNLDQCRDAPTPGDNSSERALPEAPLSDLEAFREYVALRNDAEEFRRSNPGVRRTLEKIVAAAPELVAAELERSKVISAW